MSNRTLPLLFLLLLACPRQGDARADGALWIDGDAGPVELPTGGRHVTRAAWDPAGERLAVVAWPRAAGPRGVETARTLDQLADALDGDLFLVDLAAPGTWRALADSPATDYNPIWAPDGEALLFVSTRGGRAALYLTRPASGETWRVPVPAPPGVAAAVPVSGQAVWDAGGLAFEVRDGEGNAHPIHLATEEIWATAIPVDPSCDPDPGAAYHVPSPSAGERGGPYTTRDPGPLDLPADWLDVQGEMIPFDVDPAEGAIADYSGWYGTEWEEDHATDGHAGTDFAMPTGTEVLASARGVVVDLVDGVPVDEPDAANYVVLAHGNPGEWRSTYWHLSPGIDEYVAVKDEVERGDTIALSNHTGDSWAPHLHFGTFHWGQAGCPFFEGYWYKGLTFFQGVYQYLDAPVLDDTGVTAEEVGQQLAGAAYCGTETVKSGHYRYWRPLDWGTVVQALDRHDDLEHPDDFTESGPWESAFRGSTAPHVLGEAARVTEHGPATATFVPRIGTETEYEVLVTWGRLANARDVRYRVTHRDGTDEVVLDQHGGGAGTEELPRIVTASPFVDRDDVTRSSSYLLFHYACDGAPEQSGAEVIYKVTTATEGDIEALLLADPGVELDVVLLDKLEESGCLQWGDMLVLQEDAPAGTYWIVVDTRTEGTEAPAPGGYELRVTFGGEPDGDSAMAPGQADTWVSLGSYPFAPGKDPAQGAIALELDEGPVPVIEGPARAVADAVWLYNPGRDFFAFGEGAEGSEVAEDILILKEYAAVGVASAESWPVREAPSADAPVRFRARQGQRFLSDTNYEGWYEIHAPELGYEVGYLHEDAGFVYNRLVEEPIPEGDDDDSAAPPPGDDDGCECDAAPGAGVGAVAWLALLVTGLVSRRARRSPPGRR